VRRRLKRALEVLGFAADAHFIWTLGGAAVASAVVGSLVHAVVDMPDPLLLLLVVGVFLLSMGATARIVRRLMPPQAAPTSPEPRQQVAQSVFPAAEYQPPPPNSEVELRTWYQHLVPMQWSMFNEKLAGRRSDIGDAPSILVLEITNGTTKVLHDASLRLKAEPNVFPGSVSFVSRVPAQAEEFPDAKDVTLPIPDLSPGADHRVLILVNRPAMTFNPGFYWFVNAQDGSEINSGTHHALKIPWHHLSGVKT
jgi:hypothetical protein